MLHRSTLTSWLVVLTFHAALMVKASEPALETQWKTPDISFPACDAVVVVTQPPYNAKGDGKSDDTDAIQRAVFDAMGLHKIIYLPAGTYLVSKTINWSKKNSAGDDAWGKNIL